MAKVNGVATQISGKVGELMFVQTKHGTIVYEAPTVKKTPRRSEQQMNTRTQWANLGATYMMFDGTLKRGFEALPTNMSVYNAFVQANLGVVKVYITKAMRLNGGCVLAPYQITRGSLPSITMALGQNGVLVSGLSLGGLEITATTTVGEFSQAIIANNAGWQVGDQLTFFLDRQTLDPVTSIPRATLTPNKVVLDAVDENPLWNIVGSEGFSSVQGSTVQGSTVQGSGFYLGMNAVLLAGAAAWVHSREADGGLKVSTQFLYVENAALASYQTSAALIASANSYGGINTSEVYLQPGQAGNAAISASAAPSVPSGESGTGTNTGGSSTGSEQGSGGNTGGSGTGSVTPATVTAPSFAGETQFEESTEVTITGPDGATIHYTVDGSTPTAESAVYSEPLTFTETTTLKAIAVKDGQSSAVTSRTYTKGSGSGGNGTGGED